MVNIVLHLGFDEGQIQFDNDNSMQAYATTEGILPEGGSSFGADVKLAFCCRQDGSPHDPIRLANDEPFAMYPMQSACQKVQGQWAAFLLQGAKNIL